MFKVHENADGSMSIFCNKSGRFLYKTGKQQKSMGVDCDPVSVIDSSPKNQSHCFNTDTEESNDVQVMSDKLPDVPAKESETVEVISVKQPDLLIKESNLPTWTGGADEDFSAECITSEDYARCLNLVSTEKLKHQPINKLKTEFPLRFLSRTKSLNSDRKYPYELPISSSVGLKVLKANEQDCIYCDETVEMKIESYENFCHSHVNSCYVFNHTNFRCRDKRSKNSKFHTTHRYTFNRIQRLENVITIKTGLDQESRKLLLKCNKRLTVSVKRLPDEEIKYWMQKRARIDPIHTDLVEEDSSSISSNLDASVIEQNSVTYVDLCSDTSSEDSDNDDPLYLYGQNTRKVSNFQNIFSSSSSALHNLNEQSPKPLNTYSEENKNCLNSPETKTRDGSVFNEFKFISPRHGNAYHLPFSSTITDKKKNFIPNSNCHNYKNSKLKVGFKKYLKENSSVKNKTLNSENINSSKSLNPQIVKSYNCLKRSVNKSIEEVVIIPIIDLTTSPPNSPKKFLGTCTFHCYGCGDNTKNHNELETKLIVSEHLKAFHCIPDPEPFLYIKSTSYGIVMEAFPGYKNNSLG